ncbi:protein starmaker-like [Chironomus tepperi]|uniref:protein starmaker-like n=1 Tax=Chironomus tepperi TaxID=113505 RepID=UPI00391EF2B2
MEQQHHNYEYGETFGFINAAFAEPENFPHNQEDQASKTNIPSIAQDSSSLAPTDLTNPHSVYNLTSECKEPSNEIPNEPKPEENQSDCNIQFQTAEDTVQKEVTNENVQETIENPENITEDTEKTTKENATSELNVDETATGSSEKAVGSKSFKRDISGKKRRRIVVLNDDDSEDEENELKKELLNRSSDIEQDDKKSDKSSEQDADSENDSEEEKPEELASSTNRNFLKAKYLLKTAVIIEDPDKNKKKKKKQRVLDSDDEDQLHTSVDDIGLLGNENENEEEEEEIFTDDIVIINNDPIVAPEEATEESSTTTEQPEKEPELENKEENVSDKAEAAKEPVDENLEKTEEKVENEGQKSPKDTESLEKPAENNEEEDVNAVLDKIQPMDDDDDFFKFNDTTDEDEQKDVTNDKYFGTPDKQGSNTAVRGRRRGPVTRGAKAQPRKRGSQYEKDFVDDSDSESSYSDSISSSSSGSSSSSRERVKKRPPPSRPGPQNVKAAQNLIRNSVTITKVPTKKEIEQKGRFYDKSRNIPNDVYFGDVNVPLHVLHSRWNSDGQSDRVRKAPQFPPNRPVQRPLNASPAMRMTIPSQNTIPQAPRPTMHSFRPQLDDDSKLSIMKEFMKVCGLKINYGKLFHNVKTNAHKCALLRRILVQKGMDGEPTMAKCKKLKLELQAKREIAELDKSVILPVEGRTRRSRRGAASKDSEDSMTSNNEGLSSNVQPEVLETLTKIKSVIDSDSD